MKGTVFIATSLDGFIARSDGGIDWLPATAGEYESEDYGYQALMDSVDALVMGRNTFDLIRTFGSSPYGDKPVIVLSHRPVEIPDGFGGVVEWMSAPPPEVIRQLAARGMGHIYVDGGQTIQGFLAAGLIQRLIITRIPILIGSGIPLFGPLAQDIRLRHLETRAYPSGLVQSHYEVLGESP